MTPEQITIVQDTFAAATPRADELSRTFYEILFRDHPAVRELFPQDMDQQRKALVATLAAVVTNITNPEVFTSRVSNLGKRHTFYGAQEAHYPAVGAALLETLGVLFGQAFTTDVRAAWAAAYGAVADTMIAAAAQVQPRVAV